MKSGGRRACTALCVSVLVIGAQSVEARITTVQVDKTEPLADGVSFGSAGGYERVTGIARGEVDPRDPRNAVIVNLAKAPRNARGLVEYETDFYLLRPADPAKGNRKIVFEVNNRGRKLLFPFLMDAGDTGFPFVPGLAPGARGQPGDALRRLGSSTARSGAAVPATRVPRGRGR